VRRLTRHTTSVNPGNYFIAPIWWYPLRDGRGRATVPVLSMVRGGNKKSRDRTLLMHGRGFTTPSTRRT